MEIRSHRRLRSTESGWKKGADTVGRNDHYGGGDGANECMSKPSIRGRSFRGSNSSCSKRFMPLLAEVNGSFFLFGLCLFPFNSSSSFVEHCPSGQAPQQIRHPSQQAESCSFQYLTSGRLFFPIFRGLQHVPFHASFVLQLVESDLYEAV